MQIQNHLSKISWTIADKILFVIYGFVFLLQISLLPENADIALFNFLISFNTWIFVLSDSFALQTIIQYGYDEESRNKVNSFALILHLIIVLSLSGLVFILQYPISDMFSEPRFNEITTYLPVLSLLMIPRTFCSKLMLRDHAMYKIFISNFVFFGVMIFRILSYKFSANSITLNESIYIYLEGAGLSSVVAILLTLKQLKFSLTGDIRLKKIVSFSIPFTITNGINTIPKYLDTILLNFFFSLEQIGIYTAARSLFKFFEEGMNGVNGLVYPAAVRAAANGDTKSLQSMISKSLSFTLLAYILGSLILTFGFAEFLIHFFDKTKFIGAIFQFKIMLIATLFLPFNILYFLITASGRYFELMKIVAVSFIFSVLMFIIIGFIGNSDLMPVGYVSFYFLFAIQAFRFVNNENIVSIQFKDLLRSINDSKKFALKIFGYK